MANYDDYEMTIGIECHVQLATKTKLFSASDNDARDQAPNSCVNQIDYALPGMLPVLNRQAVNLALIAGKALNSDIANVSSFDRKHYFYPDLPKGYQITQMYQPIILEGFVDVPSDNGEVTRVRIHHAHLEEDAGKLTHFDNYSLVDLNRAGTPLIEIVSEPDIHSAETARGYATELYRLMTYAGVTYGDLYNGNMRFDVNISVAKKGDEKLGKRVEVKNINSFRAVEKAAEYEFKRQIEALENGQNIAQETRGWDNDKQITLSQRSKEDAQDYRYMPDADIPPIVLTDQEIAEIQAGFPKMPSQYRQNWQDLKLDSSVINTVLDHQLVAEILDEIVANFGRDERTRRVFNWFASIQADDLDLSAIRSGLVDVKRLMELSQMVEDDKLSSTGAKEIFLAFFDQENANQSASAIAQARNLLQVSDVDEIARIVDEVLADPNSANSIKDIQAGKEKAIGYLVGQVMKNSHGKANPAMAQKLIKERLNKG